MVCQKLLECLECKMRLLTEKVETFSKAKKAEEALNVVRQKFLIIPAPLNLLKFSPLLLADTSFTYFTEQKYISESSGSDILDPA